jgi:alanine-glyoxylate transaminase/serine-glyoxylate transaminase/serine-pyruvate transaminase
MSQPLLMIPGPIEVSPGVLEAFSVKPPSHVAPHVIEAFGRSLEMMREVWCAGPDSQPFVVAGSGTLAMEMAATNLMEPGDHAALVHTGYFSERMAEMLRRRGVTVHEARAPLGEVPSLDEVAAAFDRAPGPVKALFATHVDTSTGVRVDPQALAALATERGALSVFDGVCATAGDAFEMAAWGADVYVTGSQKAIGLPPGLAMLVASARAMAAREALSTPPPMSLDYDQWAPIMRAYEERRPSYFATPATNLVLAMERGLHEIVTDTFEGASGARARFARHARVAGAMRAAWSALGLTLLPARAEIAANTLSAITYPEGVGPTLPKAIGAAGAIVAGGLHPELKTTYFRVGHMGYAVTRPDWLARTVAAVEAGLTEAGHAFEPGAGVAALRAALEG